MSFQGRNDNDEDRRVQSLYEMHLTERQAEPALVAAVQATAQLLDCPIASVTLIDREHEIFLAAVGIDRCSHAREKAFCTHTIASDEMLMIEDATADSRFADNPQVTEQGIRFYAGIALHAPDGQRIGALSVRDRQPRTFTEAQRENLRRMALVVESQLIWCADRWKRVQAQLLLTGVMKSSQDAVLLLTPIMDATGETVVDFRIRSVSAAAESVLGFDRHLLRDRLLSQVLGSEHMAEYLEHLLTVLRTGEVQQFESQSGRGNRATWQRVSVARWQDGLAVTLHDITDHKLTENQLDEIFEMSRDLMCVIDPHSRYVRANRTFEQLLGAEAGSMFGRSALQFVDPHDIDRTRQLFEKLSGGQHIAMFENRLIDRTGGRHWIQWSAQRINGTGMFFAVGRDVTEHRKVRRMLKKAERFERSIIDALTDAVAVVDSSGSIINVNRRWKQLALEHRAEPAALSQGANYLSVCRRAADANDADAQAALAGIEQVLAGGRDTFSYTYPCDGPGVHRSYTMTVTRFEHDRRPLAVICHHEITWELLAGVEAQTDAVAAVRSAVAGVRDCCDLLEAAPPVSKLVGRVLVAEADERVRQRIGFYLQRLGVTVDFVGDGRTAMDHAMAARQLGDAYRLVLMDVQLPVTDGVDATRQMRDAGYLGPIVALTDSGETEQRERCLAAGCDDYIVKPIGRTQLEQVVIRWLRTTQLLSR